MIQAKYPSQISKPKIQAKNPGQTSQPNIQALRSFRPAAGTAPVARTRPEVCSLFACRFALKMWAVALDIGRFPGYKYLDS